MIKITNILSRVENAAFIRRLFALLPGPLRRLLASQRNLVYALLVHILFLSIFIVSFDWSSRPAPSKPKVNVIDAVVVDESRVQAEIDKLKKAEQRRQQQDESRKRQLKKEQRDLAELKKRKAAEARRLQEQQKKRKAEEAKAKALALEKKSEKEKLDKLKKEQQALEKKRQEEQQRLAELEKQRQQEAEKQRQEQERKAAEQALQEQLQAEQQALEAERQRETDRIVNQYVEIIKQKVTRNWLRPPAAAKGLSCTVAVSLMPGGEVLSARVTHGSGDPLFDQSVQKAVLKASPLPLPPDAALFDNFRDLEFLFNPDD